MADTNNFGNIQENFERITDILDSMRAQNAMNSGDIDKVLVNINKQLETLSNEENSDLIKVFLAEMKRSLEERHNFVSSKFTEIETSFKALAQKSENQLEKSELKEIFEIIATNLNVFAQDFTSQKEVITDIGLKIEELKNDDSQKRDILRNISVLKMELEKFSNGFESIILNLNDKFKEISELTSSLDSSEVLDGVKKDIENIFLSSNAVLSTLQVIDRKNRELEEIINHVVTKEDFNVEREQVAKLIAQNLQITDYISTLPTQSHVGSLAEKVDTAIGVIDALKNMLNETGKQNQELLSAQLDSLESKILNISTEEEFIGFRKELAEFSQEVIQSTNAMRADLTETNEGLKNLTAYLSAMDIKDKFENFANLTKISENNVKESVTKISEEISNNIVKNRAITKTDVEAGVSVVNGKIDEAKTEISEVSKSNLSNILEHIQSVVNNIFAVKNAIHIESQENVEAIDTKLESLKDGLNSSSSFLVQRSQENMENIVSNVEKVFEEILAVKEGLVETTEHSVESINNGYGQIFKQITEIKSDLNQNSQENFANILSIVEDFSQEIAKLKGSLDLSSQENASQISGFIENLTDKLTQLQDVLTGKAEVNASEIKTLVRDLSLSLQSAETNLSQSSSIGFSGLKSNMEELAGELKVVQENFDIKSQTNLSKIVLLFEDLTREFNAHKEFLSDSTQVNFETLSLYIQNLNQRIDETKNNFSDDMNSSFAEIQSSISALPEAIKENQVVFENEKKALIEENSRSIAEMSEKVQNLVKGIVSKDSPFKGEVLYEFSELKSNLEAIKEDLIASNQGFEENITAQIISNIQNIEDSISSNSEKYDSAMQSLRGKLVEYFDVIQDATQNSDLKLDNSLRETSIIKSDVQSIIECVSELKEDSTLKELSEELKERFEGILIDIASLEENLEHKNSEALQNILNSLDAKFENMSATLGEYKNFQTAEKEELITEIAEKAEAVKAQINLAGTDVLMNLNSRTAEIVELLAPIGESVNKVAEVDFAELVLDIKKKIDSSSFVITSVVKDDAQKADAEQAEKISQEFENLNDKINNIIEKVSEDKSGEIEELKALLDIVTQRVDNVSTTFNEKLNDEFLSDKFANLEASLSNAKSQNIDALNEALSAILEKLEDLDFSDKVDRILSSTKEELFEKVNVAEDVLLQSQEDSKAMILDEIAQSKEEIKTVVLDEMSQLHEQSQIDILEKVTQSQREVKTELVEEISELNENSKSNILEKVTQSQHEIKTALVEEISQKQNEIKADVLANFGENIDSLKSDLYASTQSLITEELGKNNESSRAKIIEKLDYVEDNLLLAQSETKTELLNELKETLTGAKDELYSSTQTLLSEELEKTAENSISKVFEKFDAIKDSLVQVQEEMKTSLTEEIVKSQDGIESAIVEELQENINFIKEILNTLSADKSLDEEISNKIEDLQTTFKLTAQDIENKLNSAEQNQKTSVQLLLSEVKTSFYEKVDDSLDDLRSFLELLENKNDTSAAFDNLKFDILEKVEEYGESLETSISLISVKSDLEVLGKEIETSINDVFGTIEDKFLSVLEGSESLTTIKDKSEELERRIEEFKKVITEEISEKLDGFELSFDNQTKDFSQMVEELKTSLSELKENFVDLSLNSTMEMSAMLVNAQEKLDSIDEKVDEIDFSESFNSIETKISELSFDDKFDSIQSKLDAINLDIITDSKNELSDKLSEEFEAINQKLDVFNLDSDSEMEDSINEIKEIVQSQSELISKLEKLDDLGSIKTELANLNKPSDSEGLDVVKTQVKDALKTFETKLDSLSDSINIEVPEVDIKDDLNTFKEELFGNLVEIFSQISFVEESEDIKDFVEEKTDEIKAELSSKLADLKIGSQDSSGDGANLSETLKSSLDENFNDILSSLDILHEKASSVDNNIQEVKNHLEFAQSGLGDGSEYSYTLQDIESDIAKVRMILKELSESKNKKLGDLDTSNCLDIDKLNEDIMSISTRTNKLLLNSDESYNALRDNLGDFRNAIYQFEEKVKYLDNSESINRVEKKVEESNKLVLSCVKSDKIFNQTFMYLAEWVDTASENLGSILEKTSEIDDVKKSISELKKAMPKTANIEMALDKIANKFDTQQDRIKSLEDKVEKLAKSKTGEVDVDAIVAGILAKIKIPEAKADTKLTKKVDSIDKQLTKLGKSIEKITSYVD